MGTRYDKTLFAVLKEIEAANDKHGPGYASSHEFLGVLYEEFDEVLDAIRANDLHEARKEAIQMAAVCIKFCAKMPEK